MPALPRSGFLRARRLLTNDPAATGDALHWREGRIVAVGPAAEVRRGLPPGTPEWDLGDLLLTPGFVDGHTHFGMWALNRRRVQLAGTTRLEALRLVATAPVEQGWVLGQGWDANSWDAAPDRAMLDAVQRLPVWLDSLDVHAAWLNTAALAAVGIDRHTPDPAGGRIVRDAAGEPTGLLYEFAVDLALARLPAPEHARLRAAMLDAQTEAHRLGVTGIHDVGDRHSRRVFEELAASGDLTLRVLFHSPVAMLEEMIAAGERSGDGGEQLRLGGVKLFLDGSLGSRTAWMLEPYEGSHDRGMPLATHDDTVAVMRRATEAGIAITAHAIGDAAVRRALDVMETLPALAMPHRIEHLQCVAPADLGRAARAGLVASMQPAHILVDIPLAERHWGARSAGAYAFRSLVRHGTVVAFGSDVPVASIDPREGIFAALARTGLDRKPAGGWYGAEALDFEAAVAAYTSAPARAEGLARTRGRLTPGADADFVAWDVDPLAERGSGDAFLAGRARLTVVNGHIVWSDLT